MRLLLTFLVLLDTFTVNVLLLLLETHRETDHFLPDPGVHLVQSTFHYRRLVFSSHLKSKVGHILTKSEVLCINLNIVSHHGYLSHPVTTGLPTTPLFRQKQQTTCVHRIGREDRVYSQGPSTYNKYYSTLPASE